MAIELLAVAVPLDAVQSVPLHVVAALQHHVLPQDGVGGQKGPGESDGGDRDQACNGANLLIIPKRTATRSRHL